MKKIFAALLAAALCLTACGSGGPDDTGKPDPAISGPVLSVEPTGVSQPSPAPGPEPEPVQTLPEGVAVSLLQEIYPEGAEKLTLVLDNRSDLEVGYGADFSIEKYVDGAWQGIDFQENTAFNDLLYMVPPHSARIMTYSTVRLEHPLDEGLYRLTGSKLWMGEEREEFPPWRIDFRVTADAAPEPDYALYIPGQRIPTVQGCAVTDRLPVLFINTTGEDGQVLDIPHLEKLEANGEWAEVPYREGAGFCGTPSTLPAEGREWSESIPMLWGTLEDGQYRLSYHAGPTFETEQTAYGEFTLYTPENNQGLPLAG